MSRFFMWWKKAEEVPVKHTDTVSQFLIDTNEKFKNFLTNCSWLIYLAAGVLITCCMYYYFNDCKRRIDLRRRRQEVQRASERNPQRRRPGAAYRDHEIFCNVINTVRQYIGQCTDCYDP